MSLTGRNKPTKTQIDDVIRCFASSRPSTCIPGKRKVTSLLITKMTRDPNAATFQRAWLGMSWSDRSIVKVEFGFE